MNQAYYEGMLIRIKGGQYTLDEIDLAIDKAFGVGLFGETEDAAVTTASLKTMARKYIDATYTGNAEPRAYDDTQDDYIMLNTSTALELFDLVALTASPEARTLGDSLPVTDRLVADTAIGDSFVKVILHGLRSFESVHDSKKEEVAYKLIHEHNRVDLVTSIDYLPASYAAERIIQGDALFSDVATGNKQNVADALIALERTDLITDDAYSEQETEL